MMIVVLAALCIFLLYELYRWLVPFDSINPLWQEATIGQTVLGDWRYAGQDAEGFLKFYNSEQTVLLPPNAHLFDANGRFIVLEQHTPSSITFASPVNAIPMSWLAVGAGLLAVPVLYLWFRIKSRGGFRVKRTMKTGVASKRTFARGGASKPTWVSSGTSSRTGGFRAVKSGNKPPGPTGGTRRTSSGRFRTHK